MILLALLPCWATARPIPPVSRPHGREAAIRGKVVGDKYRAYFLNRSSTVWSACFYPYGSLSSRFLDEKYRLRFFPVLLPADTRMRRRDANGNATSTLPRVTRPSHGAHNTDVMRYAWHLDGTDETGLNRRNRDDKPECR